MLAKSPVLFLLAASLTMSGCCGIMSSCVDFDNLPSIIYFDAADETVLDVSLDTTGAVQVLSVRSGGNQLVNGAGVRIDVGSQNDILAGRPGRLDIAQAISYGPDEGDRLDNQILIEYRWRDLTYVDTIRVESLREDTRCCERGSFELGSLVYEGSAVARFVPTGEAGIEIYLE